MFSKVFIDANIFIDLNDDNRKSYGDSLKILKFLTNNRIAIYTSCDLITTIYYILAKKSRKNALDSIVELNKICQVIDFSNKEITKTCQLMTEDKLFVDLEDTLQYILAQKKNCDVIISNDRKFVSRDIDLMASTEFIGKYIS